MELDWNEGNFFDANSRFLMCATHGALHAADTGFCVGGPCRGRGLRQVTVKESEGQVFWQPDDYLRPARA
jgi:nitrite reductase/ring-hydroxylating ferredoxin subunit